MDTRNEPITDIIAIDGPAGVGKSTVARGVADALGYAFLDTGAMYRAATWWAMHNKADLGDPHALVEITRTMPLTMRDTRDGTQVIVDGHDVSEAIRTLDITERIRKLDGIAEVRACLVEHQRALGALRPTVAEGRDIGTVVFPHARCKVFMTATLEARVARRAKELAQKGCAVELGVLMKDIETRDDHDQTRSESPLRQAEDALLLDTSTISCDEAIGWIIEKAKQRT
jgi:cytidylate kinase